MDLLEGLNQQQAEAVRHDAGPLLVVAGAGTGKTQVITRRIAYLIQEGKAKPDQILALTFTEKAAREMAERLYDLIGWHAFEVPVLTFHAFGTELLAEFAPHIGRSVRGGLLSDQQKSLLLLQHIDRLKLSYYGSQDNLYEFVEGIVQYINELQNAGISTQDYRDFVNNNQVLNSLHPADAAEQRDLAALYELYETVKAETGTYDYHDQLALPLMVLQQRPNVAERLAARYRYVLVDEYQDTNHVQDQLLRAFIPPDGNLFAVGDDDQAIYGFRGADITNILDFAEHFKITHPVVLVENYRSGQPILDAAYRLIQHNNPERLEDKLGLTKRLHGQTSAGSVVFAPYSSTEEERVATVDQLSALLADGADPAGMAVLATSRAPLRGLAKSLRAKNIPFALSAEIDIFEQPELKQLWYLLQWLGYRASDESIGHVIMGAFGGWLPSTYRQVVMKSRTDNLSVEEALIALAEAGHELAKRLTQLLEEWRTWSKDEPVSRLAYRLVFESGLSNRLIAQADRSDRSVRVFEDLGRLFGQMQDYETVAIDPTLAGYLQTFPKPPAIENTEAVGDAGGVQLLTIHASKGLEFETVFLMNTSQTAWTQSGNTGRYRLPEGLLAGDSLPPEHEYRRLMYVAVTRAKRDLRISAPVLDAASRRVTTSRFVPELLGGVLPDIEPIITRDKIENSLSKLQRYYPLQSEIHSHTLPFQEGEWLVLGVNDMGLYDHCPYDFYLEKVLGIEHPYGPRLAFGTALHKVFEQYYRIVKRGGRPQLEGLQQVLEDTWSDRGYERRELADQAHRLASQTVQQFFAREQSQTGRQIMDVELPIILEVPEAKLRLRGKIDALFAGVNGIQIRDYKTGRKTDAEKLAAATKDNFQLRTYALAYEQMTGQAPAEVVLDYVVTGVEGVASLSEAIRRNHYLKLINMADGIRERNFAPKVSKFHQCAAIRYYGEALEDESEEVAHA